MHEPSKIVSMASKGEPSQSEGLQNSTRSRMQRRIIANLLPYDYDSYYRIYRNYIKNMLLQSSCDSPFPFALSSLNQRLLNFKMLRRGLPNSYRSYPPFYYNWLEYFLNKRHPLSEYHGKVDISEFFFQTDGDYENHMEQLIKEKNNLQGGITECFTDVCMPFENAVSRASPNQWQVIVYGTECFAAVLTAFLKNRFTRKFAITAGHLLTEIGQGLYAGGELIGFCCFKCKTIKIAGKMYTADLALIYLNQNNINVRDKHTVIEVEGRRYLPKLCSERQLYEIKRGCDVWIIDQFESVKRGKVINHWYFDDKGLIQIRTTDGKALTVKGDSGCCVCLPPEPGRDVIEVIGMVKGASSLLDGTDCTIAVPLPIVLNHILRNLPSSLKKVGYFFEDEGLPATVDCSEGLDFSPKSENIAVKSEKYIDFCSMESQDSTLGLRGIFRC